MNSKVVNATPHVIVLHIAEGIEIRYPLCGNVARVTTKDDPAGNLNDSDGTVVPLIRRTWGEITNLPELQEGQFVIVSSPVLDAAKIMCHPLLNRMVVPDSGPTAIRDENGQVTAVTRFIVA